MIESQTKVCLMTSVIVFLILLFSLCSAGPIADVIHNNSSESLKEDNAISGNVDQSADTRVQQTLETIFDPNGSVSIVEAKGGRGGSGGGRGGGGRSGSGGGRGWGWGGGVRSYGGGSGSGNSDESPFITVLIILLVIGMCVALCCILHRCK